MSSNMGKRPPKLSVLTFGPPRRLTSPQPITRNVLPMKRMRFMVGMDPVNGLREHLFPLHVELELNDAFWEVIELIFAIAAACSAHSRVSRVAQGEPFR